MENRRRQGLKSEETSGLRELFLTELKDIYWAEKELVKALPDMAGKASTRELAAAIEDHVAVTQTHVERLEKIFDRLGERAQAKTCEAMRGLLEEAEEMTGELGEGVVRDAAIISVAQKVEHYEIATYGTLVAFAAILGENEVVRDLEDTLNEEKETDQHLTAIAESFINEEAAEEAEE